MRYIIKKELNIGHLSTAYHTNWILMGNDDLEKDLGVKINWYLFGTGPLMVEAFKKGKLDLGYMGLPPALVGIDNNVPIKCVAGGHVEGTIFIGKSKHKTISQLNDDMFETLTQFKGCAIGTPSVGSIHDAILNYYLCSSDRRMGKRVKDVYPDILYKSMDIDRTVPHDYYSFDEIEDQFDLIILFEVIEHLELEQGVEMLGRLRELLAHGGRLIISTPNIFNPSRFWIDATHKIAYSYAELGALVLSQRLELLGIYRTFHASFLKYLFRLTLFYPLHRILNVDFAKSVVVLAGKKE